MSKVCKAWRSARLDSVFNTQPEETTMPVSTIDQLPASDIEHIDLTTHNGYITITSVKTGERRTFRIHTQKEDAKFAPGARIVSLLTGPNNEDDYMGFGFVISHDDYITIKVWRKKQGGMFDKMARMLTNLYRHMEAGHIEVNFEGRCRRCNRLLTTPESVSLGIGPKCLEAGL